MSAIVNGLGIYINNFSQCEHFINSHDCNWFHYINCINN
jgi:hypothetical protein